MNSKEPTIVIDGTTYTVRKLKLGAQMKMATIVATALKGTNLNIDTNEKVNAGDSVINIDMGAIMSQSPEQLLAILQIGLGVDESVVNNFEDINAAMDALALILKVNPVKEILGKSTTLLASIR